MDSVNTNQSRGLAIMGVGDTNSTLNVNPLNINFYFEFISQYQRRLETVAYVLVKPGATFAFADGV